MVTEATVLVLERFEVTSKVMVALARAIPVVTPHWVHAIVERTKISAPLPDPMRYLPDLAEHKDEWTPDMFYPIQERKLLFKGCTFVALSEKQFTKINAMIHASGGTVLKWQHADQNFLATLANNKEYYTNVQEFLVQHQHSHFVQESEQQEQNELLLELLQHCGFQCILDDSIGRAILNNTVDSINHKTPNSAGIKDEIKILLKNFVTTKTTANKADTDGVQTITNSKKRKLNDSQWTSTPEPPAKKMKAMERPKNTQSTDDHTSTKHKELGELATAKKHKKIDEPPVKKRKTMETRTTTDAIRANAHSPKPDTTSNEILESPSTISTPLALSSAPAVAAKSCGFLQKQVLQTENNSHQNNSNSNSDTPVLSALLARPLAGVPTPPLKTFRKQSVSPTLIGRSVELELAVTSPTKKQQEWFQQANEAHNKEQAELQKAEQLFEATRVKKLPVRKTTKKHKAEADDD